MSKNGNPGVACNAGDMEECKDVLLQAVISRASGCWGGLENNFYGCGDGYAFVEVDEGDYNMYCYTMED